MPRATASPQALAMGRHACTPHVPARRDRGVISPKKPVQPGRPILCRQRLHKDILPVVNTSLAQDCANRVCFVGMFSGRGSKHLCALAGEKQSAPHKILNLARSEHARHLPRRPPCSKLVLFAETRSAASGATHCGVHPDAPKPVPPGQAAPPAPHEPDLIGHHGTGAEAAAH